jgi:formylglycine-generating enzyme required for sulfatase activity
MEKIKIYGWILLFGFIFLLNGSFAQKVPHGIALDKTKTVFLDKTEIAIADWKNYYFDMQHTYGKNSAEANNALPDTALFRQVYGFSFFPIAGSSKEAVEQIRDMQQTRPMVCVSYQQVLDYCQWRADKVNELWRGLNKPYTVAYSLPSKEDYDKAMQHAIVSQNEPLSPTTAKNKFTGLTDNVAEYTQDKDVYIASGTSAIETVNNVSLPAGFRCKATVTKTDTKTK